MHADALEKESRLLITSFATAEAVRHQFVDGAGSRLYGRLKS